LAAMAQGDTTSIGDDLKVLEEKVSARLEVTANAVVTAANAFSASIANAVNLGQAAALREEPEPTQGPPRAVRHRLPEERPSLTHKFGIAGHEGYITVGLYPNGQPGEIFIKMAKEGSTVSGLMDSFATATSLALQHGVPLKVLCEKFAHSRFEPSGWTGNEHIGYAKSIMDYIFRWLQLRFLSGQQLSLFAGFAPQVAQLPASPTILADPELDEDETAMPHNQLARLAEEVARKLNQVGQSGLPGMGSTASPAGGIAPEIRARG